MITIQVDENVEPAFDLSLLEQAAQEALRSVGTSPEAEITIVISGDAQLQELNRRFLGIDAPTDVLSFPEDFIDPDTENPYLGDIIISQERAEAQAQAGGHTVSDEVQLLVVHGVLHLLGYDHSETEDKDEMWAIQSQILHALGVQISPP